MPKLIADIAPTSYQPTVQQPVAGPDPSGVIVKAAELGLQGYEMRATQLFEKEALQGIKRQREQGALSATQARIQVGKAIREQGARFPGMEESFRRQAGVFFGEFGPGDMTLDQTAAEKSQAKAMDTFLKEGVKYGFISPYDPQGDIEGQQAWRKLVFERTVRTQEHDIATKDYELGKIGADRLAAAYNNDVVDYAIGNFMSDLINRQKAGEAIQDDVSLQRTITSLKEAQKFELGRKLRSTGRTVPQTQREALLGEIDARWEGVEKMVANGSLRLMMEKKSDLLTSTAKVAGASAFPELFVMNSTFPGMFEEILNIEKNMQRMTPEQRDNYIALQGPATQAALKSLGGNTMQFLSQTVRQVMNNGELTGDKFLDQMSLGVIRDYAGAPASYGTPEEQAGKSDAVATVIALDTPKNIVKMATQPGAIKTIAGNPEHLEALKNQTQHIYGPMIQRLNQAFLKQVQVGTEGVGRGRRAVTQEQAEFVVGIQGDKFVVTSAKTGETTKRVGRAGRQSVIPAEIRPLIDQLNQINKIVSIYGPKLGITDVRKWRQDTAAAIMTTPRSAQ